MTYYKPVYNPMSEHDFISLAMAHDAMDKHVPASGRTEHGTQFCIGCQMPWLNGKIENAKGNVRIRNSDFARDIEETGSKEYMQRVLAYYMQTAAFPMVEAIIEHYWDPAFEPILMKYFMPAHRAVSAKYARVAYWIANITKQPTDELRRCASLDPEWGLAYAQYIDKNPHAVTRAAAVRNADTAVAYARLVDKAYHPATLGKALQDKDLAFKYLTNFSGVAEVKDAVYRTHVMAAKSVKSVLEWAGICGGSKESKAVMLEVGDGKEVLDYALWHHRSPDDELRAVVLAKGDPHAAVAYAQMVDKQPRDDTRAAASKEPKYALAYAQYIDKAANEVTRLGVLADPCLAVEYAQHVEGPHDDTRLAASKDPSCAMAYAMEVDKGRHPVTLAGVITESDYSRQYAECYGACDATRAAACKSPEAASLYARQVDKAPRDDTRTAASYNMRARIRYEQFETAFKEAQAKEATV